MIYLYKNPKDFPPPLFDRAIVLLPEDRQAHILAYRQAADRNRALIASLLLRWGMKAEYPALGMPEILRTAQGKPVLAGGFPFFSVSHSGDYVGCVLSDTAVGLDIQKVTRVSDGVVNRVCTEAERAGISSPETFCVLWTRKESVAKLTGEGITGDFRHILCRHAGARTRTCALDGAHYLSVSQWDTESVPNDTDEITRWSGSGRIWSF